MNMQTFFSEITALCRDEQFLHSVMEKYHYSPEEYPNLKRLAGEMIPCLETEAGWQDREIKETFPGRDQSFLAVGIASVDDKGKVTANAVGTTKITAKAGKVFAE